MNSLTTLSVSRTSRLVERTNVSAPRGSKNNPHSPTAPTGKRDSAKSRFLTTLLRSLATAAV